MRNPETLKLLLGILLSLLVSCEEFSDHEKYQRPDWLPGKLYTTVSEQESLSMFAGCLELTGLDTILDVSGSFTVFAPTNEAMQQYLAENHYGSISDIPLDELEKITKFHIIQNPWTLEQLQILSTNGWRTGDNANWNTYAYKRKTILKNPNEKYWVVKDNNDEMIVLDSISADGYKKVLVDSRKYAPIFYDDYVDYNGITSDDYSFYFARPYEPGNVYYAGGKILQSDIFAENGFVHIIDRVVDPMLNAEEMLDREYPGETYKLFLEMVYWYYPDFGANMAATNNQPEVRFGGVVDTLWDLNYFDLAFSLQQESTGYEGPGRNESLVRHNGLYVPTDQAFRDFVDGILTIQSGYPHWKDLRSLPKDIADLIIKPHFKSEPIYPSRHSYQDIFITPGSQQLSEGDIIRKEFGSNSTFIGLEAYIPDRIFTSVTGPVFLRSSFSHFRRALLYSGTDEEIANYDGELCFFPIPDFALEADSSLMLNWYDYENNDYYFMEYNRTRHSIDFLSSRTLASRIRNQVGTSLPNGSANKEFIPTLGGNYIIWNHTDNTVQGVRPSTIGYNGEEVTVCVPLQLEEPADNGMTFSVRYWFNAGNVNIRAVLSRYSAFFNLLLKAGLFDPFSANTSFLDRNQNYTVFVPSEQALLDYQADTLNNEALVEFLKYHFVQGSIIFTDNKQPSGDYPTTNGEMLNVQTGPDRIQILDGSGVPYITIPEDENRTNIMVSEGARVTSVVHEMDHVLVRE